jgi:TetR/AcrR family transcriptional regulator
MGKIRDLERTRERILKAASAEFAAKGLAGARTNAIARAAAVNKRMLFYCFGSKEDLYAEVMRRQLVQRARYIDAAPEDVTGLMLHCAAVGADEVEWIRMTQWEALDSEAGAVAAGSGRRGLFQRGLKKLKRMQDSGELPPDTDLNQLLQMVIALTISPIAFPQFARIATGLDPMDERFRRKRREFLSWLASRLSGRTDTRRQRPSSKRRAQAAH